MTVSELIEQLKLCTQDKPVLLNVASKVFIQERLAGFSELVIERKDVVEISSGFKC